MSENIFEQNRMPRLQFCGQQTEGWDHWQTDIVFDGDKLRLGRIVYACDGFIIAGIDF